MPSEELQGEELYESVTGAALVRKEQRCTNRCEYCWHDLTQRCMCHHARPHSLHTTVNVKVLVLMHSKEYLNPGTDAKLLLAMLPPERAKLYVYGRPGDLAALRDELAIAPRHTLLLWPGEGALTVEAYLEQLGKPPTSFARATAPTSKGEGTDAVAAADADTADADAAAAAAEPPPLLRVLVLDGVYNDAAAMFRHLRKRGCAPPHLGLHPNTLSVYRRATHGYSGSVGADPAALRICTVEAVALLLEELGEPPATTRTLVAAIEANNAALANVPGSGPVAEPVGRRARRRRREAGAEAPTAVTAATATTTATAAATATVGAAAAAVTAAAVVAQDAKAVEGGAAEEGASERGAAGGESVDGAPPADTRTSGAPHALGSAAAVACGLALAAALGVVLLRATLRRLRP